jgi:GntR family transcriptional repressor for pyruvate dehydrogenase complex
LAFEMSGGRISSLRQVTGGLHEDRLAIVEALESRSAQRAAEAVDAYDAHSEELILSSPQAKKIQVADPGYTRMLAGMVNAKLGSTVH